MRKASLVLTVQELEIMKAVWARGETTVRDVYEALLEQRKIAYTTVMTMMGILEEKGYLTKTSDGKAHVYKPAQPRERVVGGMVADFIERVFDGSAKPLLLHLVEGQHVSAGELDEIAAMRRKAKARKPA